MDDRTCSMRGRTVILGHRGSPLEAPENTLPSFIKALEQGADGIELDVHLTSDGAAVVAHNYSLQKTTDGRGLLVRRTLAQLKLLDAGAYFSGGYAGTRIPTLQEVIEALDRKAFIMIEIKTYLGGANRRTAGAVAAAAAAGDLYKRTVISSFNPLILKWVKQADCRLAVGWLHSSIFPVFPGRSSFALFGTPDVLHPFHKFVNKKYMEHAGRFGCRVIPWTVNEVSDFKRMIGLGVDGVITDRPGVLKSALRQISKKKGWDDAC